LYKDEKGTIECRTFSNVKLMQKKKRDYFDDSSFRRRGKDGAGKKVFLAAFYKYFSCNAVCSFTLWYFSSKYWRKPFHTLNG